MIEAIFKRRGMKLVCKFNNLMVGEDRNKQPFSIVETWYVYQKDYS